jgi:hypothetical protein
MTARRISLFDDNIVSAHAIGERDEKDDVNHRRQESTEAKPETKGAEPASRV